MAKKWLDKYNDGGPIQPNYNDAKASTGPGYVGSGYDTTGRNYSPAWGGQFADGGGIPSKTFLQPSSYNLPPASYKGGISSELATSIGGVGDEPAYLIPTFKHGKPVKDPEGEYIKTGQHLGGPFKTWQEAEKFGEMRHEYVEQGKNIPSPLKWWGDMQDGGKMTLPEAIVYGHKDPKVKDYFDKVRTDAEKWRDEYYWNTPTAGYHALEQMHNKYGAPKINTIGEKDRAYYNPINDSMNISIPKYGDEYGDPVEDQFLHELAHKVQANKKGNVGFVKDFVGKDLINTLKNVDSSDIFTKKGWLDAYRKNYTTKGTVENEAHSVIAPKLEEEYRDIRSKQYDRLYGDMAMGGALPGAVGFTYARTVGAAPSNGKYAKKTKASAQNGKEMSFYQQGLDWKPNNISRDGSVIKDDRGQWAYPGEITQINSNDITMQGVDYPVLGVSDTGDAKMMQPGEDYKFDGEKVTEYPMAQNGDWLSKYTPEPIRQDATRVAPPVLKLTDKEKLANVAKSDQAQKRALSTAKEVIAERTKNKATKGNLNTPGSWHTADKLRLSNIVPSTPGDAVDVFDEYLNIPRYVGSIADQMGEGIAKRDVGQIAGSVGEAALAGVLGIDPLTSVSKTPRKLLNAVDRNFSEVGQDLAHFEKIGRERGWSPQKIKETQMKHVGITSNQREAYTPVLSNLAEKYITPYGYSGMQGESKIQQIINNIKKGGVKLPKTDNSLMRTEVSPERSDAWRLYLGKPQQHNTFRIANTSPVNHPSYTPEQLSKMDIYSINSDFSKLGIGPDTYSPNLISPRRIEENMAMLRNKINIDKGNEIMGGYNKRLNQYGLEYNDIWDLQPSIRPADYLPNSLKESSLFSKTSKEGVTSPRFFKIDASKVLGKPFMSHEVMPYTSTDLKNQMGYVFDEQLKHLKSSNFDMTPKINKIEAYKEELKNYPKYKQGGWLNKYK